MPHVSTPLLRTAFLTSFMLLYLMVPRAEALTDFQLARPAMGYNLDDNSFFSSTMAGYAVGDPAPGKLIPYYEVTPTSGTIIKIESTLGKNGVFTGANSHILVHIVIFGVISTEVFDVDLCLSPFDQGFVVLQQEPAGGAQLDELASRGAKVLIASVNGDFIPSRGYVTLRATALGSSCTDMTDFNAFPDGADGPLAAWASLVDVGTGFGVGKIPAQTAIIDRVSGQASGGAGASGLIPSGNTVVARYDVNSNTGANTRIIVWLSSNGTFVDSNFVRDITAVVQCEDEQQTTTTLSLPYKVNVIDPAALVEMGQCPILGQFRGVLRFDLPDDGFVWSQITQTDSNVREDLPGYNLDTNTFLSASSPGQLAGDPAAGKLVPYYKVSEGQTTVIGLENVLSGALGAVGDFIFVHVVLFDELSTEVFDVTLCLSPYDYGFIILQQDPASGAQLTELINRGQKVLFASVAGDFIPAEGYVTLRATGTASDCAGTSLSAIDDERALAAWATVIDVGTGFGELEIPTATALVNGSTGVVMGDVGSYGLIPSGNTVIAPFNIDPSASAETDIVVWLNSNGTFNNLNFVRNVLASIQCEDELEISTTIPLPHEVNVIDPASLGGMGQCLVSGQFRGVLRFDMPDDGLVWSHLRVFDTLNASSPPPPPQLSFPDFDFERSAIGYNLDTNSFFETGMTGYVVGDPAPGKLVPYYRITPTTSTLIRIENTSGKAGPLMGQYIVVHVVIFDTQSTEFFDVDLCLSPFDYGFITLQQDPASGAQFDELGPKVVIASVTGDFIPAEGYVTLRATGAGDSCSNFPETFPDGVDEPLATWAALVDAGLGSVAEIPTLTAVVHPQTGQASGGSGAFGLVPAENTVIARYEVNPDTQTDTQIFVWLASTAPARTVSAFLQCEDELQISTTISLPNEVNVVDPASLVGMGQCLVSGQFRGVLRFDMPDDGAVWSHIRQAETDVREHVLGYNLDVNSFLTGALPLPGQLAGDPAAGKLIPSYEVNGSQTTVIGLENVLSGALGAVGDFIFVHVVIFDVVSTEVFDVTLCLSPYDYGFIILQQDPASGAQLDELGPKVLIASVTGDFIPAGGYVTLRATATGSSCSNVTGLIDNERALAAWATVLSPSGAIEIPTATALVDPSSGHVSGGTGAFGLVPSQNTVISQFSLNSAFNAQTTSTVWLKSNGVLIAGGSFVRNVSGFLNCEDELQISTTIPLPFELNRIDPAALGGVGQCVQANQHRGVLRFDLPDDGMVWSQIRGFDSALPIPVIHDLAVTKITAPKRVRLTVKKPIQTRTITVQIQNQSPHTETIPDLPTLDALVSLTVEALQTCPNITPTLIPPKKFPVTIKSKKKSNVKYTVPFGGCVPDPAKTTKKDPGHEDFRYVAYVDHAALNGKADADPFDDVCPRMVTPPFRADLFPDGKIKDKGCGTRKADKTFGADVLTDIF